jgi:hypothetical protein
MAKVNEAFRQKQGSIDCMSGKTLRLGMFVKTQTLA